MAGATISHLRRGAQRHALLCLSISRRRFSSTAASPLAAAARRLLSTTVDAGASSSGEHYKPPPFDPFRAATLSPSAPPLESPPVEDEPPSSPPPPEEAAASEAAHEQATLACQEVELEGLKAGVEAVKSREESPEEKEAWWRHESYSRTRRRGDRSTAGGAAELGRGRVSGARGARLWPPGAAVEGAPPPAARGAHGGGNSISGRPRRR
jgi:hypothetical protein